jgi:hypothetical protein
MMPHQLITPMASSGGMRICRKARDSRFDMDSDFGCNPVTHRKGATRRSATRCHRLDKSPRLVRTRTMDDAACSVKLISVSVYRAPFAHFLPVSRCCSIHGVRVRLLVLSEGKSSLLRRSLPHAHRVGRLMHLGDCRSELPRANRCTDIQLTDRLASLRVSNQFTAVAERVRIVAEVRELRLNSM